MKYPSLMVKLYSNGKVNNVFWIYKKIRNNYKKIFLHIFENQKKELPLFALINRRLKAVKNTMLKFVINEKDLDIYIGLDDIDGLVSE